MLQGCELDSVQKMICTNDDDFLDDELFLHAFTNSIPRKARKVYETPELIYLLMTQGASLLTPHLLI